MFRLSHIFKPEAGDLAAEQQGERLLRKTCPMILSAPCMILHRDGKWGYSQSDTVCSASSNMKHKKELNHIQVPKETKTKTKSYHIIVQSLRRVRFFATPYTAASSSILWYVLEFAQIHVHWVNDAI